MKTIVIKTIPHDQQRYPTVGDYFDGVVVDSVSPSGGSISTPARHVRVSDMENPDYEFLVALHELIEDHLVRKRGISDNEIDEFDKAFELVRLGRSQEPGDHPNAPYHQEHIFATSIERLVAKELGVDWKDYTLRVMDL